MSSKYNKKNDKMYGPFENQNQGYEQNYGPNYGNGQAPYGYHPGYPYGPVPRGQEMRPPAGAYHPQGPAAPAGQGKNAGKSDWVNFSDKNYLKGFLVAAGLTLVASNPTVQKAAVKSAVKVWSFIQGGFEEVKEQMLDVKAEMSQDTSDS